VNSKSPSVVEPLRVVAGTKEGLFCTHCILDWMGYGLIDPPDLCHDPPGFSKGSVVALRMGVGWQLGMGPMLEMYMSLTMKSKKVLDKRSNL
jgi:hypothetical protein